MKKKKKRSGHDDLKILIVNKMCWFQSGHKIEQKLKLMRRSQEV